LPGADLDGDRSVGRRIRGSDHRQGQDEGENPAGTQSNRRFRIASKGMPVLRSRQTGDMYVQVVVETPQNLTKKQQELLSEFEKLSSGATQPGIRSDSSPRSRTSLATVPTRDTCARLTVTPSTYTSL
jgi:DnaJ-class molecular chaperone